MAFMPSEHLGRHTAIALSAALLLVACNNDETGNNTHAASPTVEEPSTLPVDDMGETVRRVKNCVLETPEGSYEGPCERVEWEGPSFSIRRARGKAFVDGITEVVVEVDRPGEKAGGSFRRGLEGDLVPVGPLTFRDDCACWVGTNFRIGAFPDPDE
ncbi:MAG: hypothetical protein BGO57_04960 [Sphingomonadales bacterium 63-6]|nr:MAG: hypothetical protein BGO57_04960 [Sphingomonadales bacterium 63-6]